jgi:hypothetical protein
MSRRSRLSVGLTIVLLAAASIPLIPPLRQLANPVYTRLRGQATVGDRLGQYGPSARAALRPMFERADLSYPPEAAVLVGLKQERRVDIYGRSSGKTAFVTSYPILGASGGRGPILREGDRQVPEGV